MKILWIHPYFDGKIISSSPRLNLELLKQRSLTSLCEDATNYNKVYKQHCPVDRTGTYVPNMAFKFDISNYVMPELSSAHITLEQCIRDRCEELFAINKKIILFYSGGIDSMCCLAGFIRTFGVQASSERITIFANGASIKSFPYFYNTHIQDKFNVVDSTDSNITLLDDKYGDYILLSGDPANVFDEFIMIHAIIKLGIPLDSKNWKQEIKKHHSILFNNCYSDSYNLLIDVIESSASSRNYTIDNVFDFIWWYKNNLFYISYAVNMLQYFHNVLLKYNLGKEYWFNRYVPFFQTDKFTQWSYVTKQEVMEDKIKQGLAPAGYKKQLKLYIGNMAESSIIHYDGSYGFAKFLKKGTIKYSMLTNEYIPLFTRSK